MTSAPSFPAPAPDASPRRRRRWLLPLALLLVLALAAAAAVVVLRERSAPGPARAVAFPVAAVAGGADGSNERLLEVVAHERRFVALGVVTSGGRTRPVFLRSDDLGTTWQTAEVEDPDGLVGPSESPTTLTTGPKGLVALGTSDRGRALWTSPDGTSWTRRTLDEAVFTEDDGVSSVRGVPTGYLAVGHTSPTAGATRGVLWDSLDGVTWRRRDAAQLGVRVADGRRGDEFQDVAVEGRTVVIAGGEFDQGNASNKDNIAFWRSVDGGRRFVRDATRFDVGGTGTRSSVRAIRSSGGVFHAVGNGGEFDLFDDYEPVLLTSRGNGSWSRTPDAQLAGDGEDFLQDVVLTAAGQLVGVGSSGEGPLAISGAAGSPRRTPQLVAGVRQRPVDLVGVAAIGDVVVAVGDQGATGDDDALLLRRQGNAPFTPVALPEVDALAEATVSISDVTVTADGLLASGSAGGDGALYRSSDGITWTQVELPRGLADGRRSQRLTGVAADPAVPGWTAVGTSDREHSRASFVLRSDGTTVRDAGSKVLLEGPDDFDDRSLQAVALRAGTAVLVGASDDGDPHTSALALRIGQDGSLTSAFPADPSGGFEDGQPDDLRGAPGRGRVMQEVEASPEGLLAVGYAYTGLDESYAPAVWSSNDGARWGLQQLPLPSGTDGAFLSSVAPAGKGWVAVGGADSGDRTLPYAWTSPDGRTWTATALPVPAGHSGGTGTVVVTPAGTVVLGSTTAEEGADDGDTDAAGWISRDGRTWEPLSLPGVARGAGQQFVTAAAVLGDTVVGLGSAVTKDGVRTLVVRLAPEDLSVAREG